MAALTGFFRTALGRIEPSEQDRSNAPEAHLDVRRVLRADDTLSSWGISPVLIGSYKRYVSIARVKDVDVFCRLDALPPDQGAKDVLDHFFDVLDAEYQLDDEGKRRVRRQARSLQVSFPEFNGLYVDAVPARPHWDGETWEIPLREPQPGNEWKQTNPESFAALSSAMNDRSGDLYVPTVKLVRQTRRALLGRTRPGGLLIELAMYTACAAGQVEGTCQSEYYASALRGVAGVLDDLVARGVDIPDPTMPGHTVSVRATELQWESARTKFETAAQTATDASLADDRCKAAKAFRGLLGGNDDHQFIFDMPDDCNDDGTTKAGARAITAGDRHVPAGNRRFG